MIDTSWNRSMVRSSARIVKSWSHGTRLGEIKTWSISDLKGALTQVICLSEASCAASAVRPAAVSAVSGSQGCIESPPIQSLSKLGYWASSAIASAITRPPANLPQRFTSCHIPASGASAAL
ncbi:hypothetical protein [Mesorhizobium sp. NZP2077]|uniref:hypothetical protein n=1 Tax=Mesorhizobium sp. NZP2077 TaxID=2483404 RepID=UPI001FF00546|nr:hypothetical protein [Mesorhizobium sp. NZP2077]